MATLLLPLHLTFLVTGGLATAVGMALTWPRRREPGGVTLLLLLAAIAEWQLTGAASVAATTLEAKRLWAQFQYLGIATAAPLWLQFVMRYLGDQRATRAAVMATSIVPPVVAVVLAATSAHHRLLWSRIDLVPAGEDVRAVFHHGPAFWGFAAYTYGLLAVATILLARAARAPSGMLRSQHRLLLFAGSVPWVANLCYLLGIGAAQGIDATPLAFGITGVCAAVAIADLGLLELSPARLWRTRR